MNWLYFFINFETILTEKLHFLFFSALSTFGTLKVSRELDLGSTKLKFQRSYSVILSSKVLQNKDFLKTNNVFLYVIAQVAIELLKYLYMFECFMWAENLPSACRNFQCLLSNLHFFCRFIINICKLTADKFRPFYFYFKHKFLQIIWLDIG